MKLFLLKIFTWWNGQTFGTQLWTWRFGELVGADEQGNRYSTEETYKPHEWEKPHIPNMTGTPAAYRPPGSTLASGHRPPATGDYQPWTPGQ
jgi:NADH:ubiquinone oxidoreductase subunit